MLRLIARPWSLRESGIAIALLLAVGAVYCLAYTFAQGQTEDPWRPLGWGLANLVPWLAAFELAKRRAAPPGERARYGVLAAIIAGAGLVSILLEAALGLAALPDSADSLGFHALRRLPGAALVLFLFLLARSLSRRESNAVDADAVPLPLLAQQIDWIRAAGNYLEFHCAAGLVMRRMTIKQAEAALASEGFVRIHRSLLVNGARIGRIHHGKLTDEVELVDGTLLKVGGAYRSLLTRFEPRRAA